MYICVCNAYREAEIRAIAKSGACSAQAAYLELGQAPRCGRCLAVAQTLIDEVHAAARQAAGEAD